MMKRFKWYYIALHILVFTAFCSGSESSERIAVAELRTVPGISVGVAETLTEIVRATLHQTGKFEVINRANMRELLKESTFQGTSYCENVTCAAEMGKWLGVNKMVVGKLGKLGNKYIITLKLVVVKTAKNANIVEEGCICAPEELDSLVKSAAYKLTGMKSSDIMAEAKSETVSKKPHSRFIDNGDGTITDLTLNLMWAKEDSWVSLGHCLNWKQARKYIKKLRLGGYKDWRFPTLSELRSLYDPRFNVLAHDNNKAYQLHFFPQFSAGGAYWLWTSDTQDSCCAKYVDFGSGNVGKVDRGDCYGNSVRPVRSVSGEKK